MGVSCDSDTPIGGCEIGADAFVSSSVMFFQKVLVALSRYNQLSRDSGFRQELCLHC